MPHMWRTEVSFLLCGCLQTAFRSARRPPSSLPWSSSHAHSLTTSLLQCRPRCLATPCRVAHGAGTRRHLASTAITLCACVRVCVCVCRGRLCVFPCSPRCVRACVCDRVCVLRFIAAGSNTYLGLSDMFKFMFCWIWTNNTEELPPFVSYWQLHSPLQYFPRVPLAYPQSAFC